MQNILSYEARLNIINKRINDIFWATPLILFFAYFALQPVYGLFRTYFDLPRLGLGMIIVGLFTVWLFILLLTTSKIKLNNKLALSGTVLLLLVFLIQIFSYPQAISYDMLRGKEIYFETITSTIIVAAFMWVMGLTIQKMHRAWSLPKYRKICYGMYIITVAGFIYSIMHNDINGANWVENFRVIPAGPEFKVSYLLLADSFAFCTLVLGFWESNRFRKAIIFTLGAVMLFAISSRTTFYAYLLVLLIILFWKMSRGFKVFLAAVIVMLLILYGGILVNVTTNKLESEYGALGQGKMRMFNVLELQKDPSYVARQVLKQTGLETLRQHWLWGDFLGEVRVLGHGTYIHNWLSFWSAYGIIPFMWFVILSIILLKNTYSVWRKDPNNPLTSSVMALALMAFIEIIIARSYIFSYVWFAMAAMSQIRFIDSNGLRNGD